MSETGQQPPANPSAGHDKAGSEGQAPYFDPRRARARLALIEQQVTLAEALRDLEEAAVHPASPSGTADLWEVARAQAEHSAADARHWISQLAPVVGDPETIPDERGRLPRDRREVLLGEFAAKINTEVSSLSQKLPALRTDLKTTRGRQERAAIREQLRQGPARLAYLQALTPFSASDMCSECPTPMSWHATGVTFCLKSGAILSEPCRSWPVWNGKIEAGIARLAEMMRQERRTLVPEPIQEPLAVIAAGSSVEDIIARLTEVQADHPGAQVRQGKRNSWEVWSTQPPARTKQGPGTPDQP